MGFSLSLTLETGEFFGELLLRTVSVLAEEVAKLGLRVHQ